MTNKEVSRSKVLMKKSFEFRRQKMEKLWDFGYDPQNSDVPRGSHEIKRFFHEQFWLM